MIRKVLRAFLAKYAREEADRQMAIIGAIATLGDQVMSLAAEVQVLHDAVAAQSAALAELPSPIVEKEVRSACHTSRDIW